MHHRDCGVGVVPWVPVPDELLCHGHDPIGAGVSLCQSSLAANCCHFGQGRRCKMVTGFGRSRSGAKKAGYVVSELIVSSSIFCSISLGLLMGFTSLERNYAATSDFSVNHADEMRISDYMAMDLRRAIAVQAAKND